MAGIRPALVKAKNARVISVSSCGHQIGPVDSDNIDIKTRPNDKWQAYGQARRQTRCSRLRLIEVELRLV